jgi:hypothetical protein
VTAVDAERDDRGLADLTDAELVELFGLPAKGWEALVPEAILNTPTLGAIRRRQGATDWCDEARAAFAVEVVREAQRWVLLERLDSIGEFLVVGATPDQAIARIERLVSEYRGKAA